MYSRDQHNKQLKLICDSFTRLFRYSFYDGQAIYGKDTVSAIFWTCNPTYKYSCGKSVFFYSINKCPD